MNYKKLSFGVLCLLIMGFVSCEKKMVEPSEPLPQVVTVDTIPQDSVIVTNTGGSTGSGGTSTTVVLGDMSVMNGLYFGTYCHGYAYDMTCMDSVYVEVDSLGITGYEFKVYSDQGLTAEISQFGLRFTTLAFIPCDIGTPTVYSESWGSGIFHPYIHLEVIDCDSIYVSTNDGLSGGRGGCKDYKRVDRFTGTRIY